MPKHKLRSRSQRSKHQQIVENKLKLQFHNLHLGPSITTVAGSIIMNGGKVGSFAFTTGLGMERALGVFREKGIEVDTTELEGPK